MEFLFKILQILAICHLLLKMDHGGDGTKREQYIGSEVGDNLVGETMDQGSTGTELGEQGTNIARNVGHLKGRQIFW